MAKKNLKNDAVEKGIDVIQDSCILIEYNSCN